MTVTRVLSAAALAVGLGLSAVVVAAAPAQAAPAVAELPLSPGHDTPDPEIPPGLDLSHHDKRQLKKYLKEHPGATLPSTGLPSQAR